MRGTILLPGDKSISHRVALVASIADDVCHIRNFNTGTDCSATLDCLQQLGISIGKAPGEALEIQTVPLRPSDKPLDCGNSATTMRILTGLLAGQNVPAELTGDASLLRRPMRRLVDPLREMGAVIQLRDNDFAPILLQEGSKHGLEYQMPVRSAQIKSAILFAGLKYGNTRVIESIPTRDHTERLLDYLNLSAGPGHSHVPDGFQYNVPGDISAAAFFVVGALLQKNSEIFLPNTLINAQRIAYLVKLKEAGAQIDISNEKIMHNEPVGDIRVRNSGPLRSIKIEPEEVAALIDEIPALSLIGVVSGFQVSGASELRLKESDRIHAMVSNFLSLGVRAEEWEDGYRVEPGRLRNGIATTFGDHRIAMTFAVAGLPVDDPNCVKISFPGFFRTLQSVHQD